MAHRIAAALAALCTGALCSATVHALDLGSLRPSPHPGDDIALLGADRAPAGALRAAALLWYRANALTLVDATGRQVARPLAGQIGLDVQGAWSPVESISLAVDLPVFPYSFGDPVPASVGGLDTKGPALGDLRLGARWIPRARPASGLGVALAGEVSLPTGRGAGFTADGAIGSTFRALIDHASAGGRVGLEIGYRHRPTAYLAGNRIGSELLGAVGLRMPIRCEQVEAFAILTARTPVLTPPVGQRHGSGADLLGGVRFRAFGAELLAGAGGAVLDGWGSARWLLTFGAALGSRSIGACGRSAPLDPAGSGR